MNRKKLERHLTRHKCAFYARSGDHDKWRGLDVPLGTVIPRHNEIKNGTAKAICRDLGVPLPPEL